jgi:hypothetical protein
MRRRSALAIVTGLALLGPAASPASEAAHVVARDRAERAVADLRLPADGRFALAYRHSREEAPAEERYVADRGGNGFRLVAIASPDAGVLDYYELEGRRTRAHGLSVLELARSVRFATGMDLAASALGRRTLVVGSRRVPLHPRREAVHLRIRVEGA